MRPQRRLHVVHLYESWARADAVPEEPRRIFGVRADFLDDFGQLFDTALIVGAALAFDVISLAAFHIGQEVQCGLSCQASYRLHQLGIAQVLIGLVTLVPVITVLVVRSRRTAVITIQLGLCALLLSTNIAQQRHLTHETRRTTTCSGAGYKSSPVSTSTRSSVRSAIADCKPSRPTPDSFQPP
jgi:hypothetical protein